MKIKRILRLVLLLALLILSCLTLASCKGWHIKVKDRAKDPTCTSTGYAEGEHCILCGEVFLERYELPITHTGEWIYDQHPRYNVDGKRHMTCELCGEYVEERVPATGSYRFDFKMLRDGTYMVSGGNPTVYNGAIYVPEMHEGRPVTCIRHIGGPSEKITAVYIPSTVKEIHIPGIYHLDQVEHYVVAPDNPYFSSVDGNIYSADKTVFIKYAQGKKDEAFTLPEGVKEIGESSFYESLNLCEVRLSEGVENVRRSAFVGCSKLFFLSLPRTLRQIEYNAFYRCNSLLCVVDKTPDGLASKIRTNNSPEIEHDIVKSESEIKFSHNGDFSFYECPKGIFLLKYYGKEDSVTLPEYDGGKHYQVYDHAFRDNQSLREVNIPDCVTAIADYVFSDCTSLAKVNFGNALTHIGASAFSGCSSLADITLPEGVTHIGSGAFYQCQALTKIALPSTVKTVGSAAFAVCSKLENVILNDGLEVLGAQAFSSCRNLKQVTIPDSVKTIGDGIFHVCDSLTSVTLPSKLEIIPSQMFSECRALQELTIPDTVTEIGDNAFAFCSMLLELKLPEGLRIIGPNAFDGCKLSELVLPASLKQIGYGAFSGCTALKKLVIPEGVEIIEDSLFHGSAITEVILPRSVKVIKTGAFNGINLNAVVKYNGSMDDWSKVDIVREHYHASIGCHVTIICTDGELIFQEK